MTRAADASEGALTERLARILHATPVLLQVLRTGRKLNLPDWLVLSGAVYQPVLNQLTWRALGYGIEAL
jgi:hypothetical protein